MKVLRTEKDILELEHGDECIAYFIGNSFQAKGLTVCVFEILKGHNVVFLKIKQRPAYYITKSNRKELAYYIGRRNYCLQLYTE